MTSAFRNNGVYKVAISFAMGGVAGWLANEEVGKYDSKDPANTSANGASRGSLQQLLASWTNSYRSTAWDHNWDRRDPKSLINPKKLHADGNQNSNKDAIDPKKLHANGNQTANSNKDAEVQNKKTKAMRHLLLIRHGQYKLNGEDDSKRFLTELGRQQADLTGKRLFELGHPYKIMIHSSMTRAKETADLIHKHLNSISMVECNMLQEGAPFPPEPPLSSWKPDHKFYEDGARIEAAFRKYFYRPDPQQTEDSYEVIVCHANVIRYFVCRALQLPPEAWLRMSLRHGSITWVSITSSGRVALRALGDCGHMSPEKLTVQ